MILLFVCLLTATGTVSAKPKPPAASLAGNEAVTIGLGIFPNSSSYPVFGAAQLEEMAHLFVLELNASAIRSDVADAWVLTALQRTNIPISQNGRWLTAAQIALMARKSKPLRNVMSATGADVTMIWANSPIRGAAAVPTIPQAFVPDNGFAVDATGGGIAGKIHEAWHLLGLQHNPEASEPPGTSTWPTAVGYLRADGACDALSYCADSRPILSGPDTGMGDALHNNVAQARRAGPWVAAYNPLPPRSRETECAEDVTSTCLSGRFLVRVQWASVPQDNLVATGYAVVKSKGNDGGATFDVKGTTVQVGTSIRREGTRTVFDLAVNAPAPSVPYRVWVTDTRTGIVRAWQAKRGQALNLTIPAAF